MNQLELVFIRLIRKIIAIKEKGASYDTKSSAESCGKI